MQVVSNGTLLPRQTQALRAHPTLLVVQDRLDAAHLQRALGTEPLCNLNPQGHLPPQVEVGSRLVVGLQQQGGSQLTGRHAAAAIVQTVQRGKIGVAEQVAPQRG